MSEYFYVKADHIKQVIDDKDKLVEAAMKAVALEMEKNAILEVTHAVYESPPAKSGYIRTGNLRNGITHDSDETSAAVGTNIEYAPYVEYGTSKYPTPRPFIKPALSNHWTEYRKLLERLL